MLPKPYENNNNYNNRTFGMTPMSLRVHGNGYVTSNKPIIDLVFSLEFDFILPENYPMYYTSGTLVSISNHLDNENNMYIEYNPVTSSVVCTINGQLRINEGFYIDTRRLEPDIPHHFEISNNSKLWVMKVDDYVLQNNVTDFPVLDSVSNVYFGGNNFDVQGATGSYLTNMKVNGELVTCDTQYFSAIGNVTTSCYITDALAIEYPMRVTCTDACTKTYKTSYTANTPWDALQCCYNIEKVHAPDIGPNNAGLSPFLAYQSEIDGNVVQFIYDRDKIDNIAQVDNALRVYRDGGKVIQDAFCESKTLTDCPPDMKNGCSRYFAVNKEGDYCRDLFNKKSDVEKDVSIFNYCTRNDTNECKCVNRVYDPDYIKLKQGNPYLDSCWYIPCANSTRYLVPSELKRQGECPENICQIVFDISQAHDVDIDHIKADINCDFSGGGWPNHIVPWYYVAALVLSIILLLVYVLK